MSSSSALTPQLIAAIEAGAWVLTPTQRSAHWLKLLYANHALSQGRQAWATPTIHSFNAFIAQLWRVSSGVGAERVLSTEQSRLLWNRVVAATSWSESLLSPQAAANAAFRSWERLHAWQIEREQLRAHAATADSSEARALLEWSDRFHDACRESSWLPVASLPERLLTTSIVVPVSHVVVIGEDELLPARAALFDRLAAQGMRCERLAVQSATSQPIVAGCESDEDELASAAVWARQQVLRGSRSIAVLVPNLDERTEEVRRVFSEVFAQTTRTFTFATGSDRSRQESSFAIAGYHRLVDFPLVRAALDVLALGIGRASGSLVGGILRSPFVVASRSEGSQRALCDARLRSQVREHYDYALLGIAATASHCPILSESLRQAHALRLQRPSRALPSAMAEHFIELWRAFGWPGENVLDSDEQQIAARLQACLAEFGALDELLGPLNFATAVREFEQLARGIGFEPRSLPAPVTVIDSQGADGLQFEAVWVGGMDDMRWPPAPAPDAFIPIALQVRAGMPYASADLAHRHAHRRFTVLQGMAPTVVFSWARRDRDIDVLPSPWLHEFAELKTDPQSTALSIAQPIDSYAMLSFATKPKLDVIEEASGPSLTQGRVRGGVRIFELQSRCPFRAFAELRLQARPLDAVAPDVDARERGTLIHAALADVWQTLGGSIGLRAHTGEQLEVLVRTALARHATNLLDGASPHRVRMLQIEQELATERILELFELDRQRAAFRVVGRPETSELASIGGLTFELRLDRMDELLDEPRRGQRIVVDYKTGDKLSTPSWLRERPQQPQLPVYAVTHSQSLAAVAFATVGAKGVAYQGVAREDGVLPGIKAFDGKNLPQPYVEWDGLLSYWRTTVERLARDFAAGSANVDPLPAECRYCHLSALCRIHEASVLPDNDGEDL